MTFDQRNTSLETCVQVRLSHLQLTGIVMKLYICVSNYHVTDKVHYCDIHFYQIRNFLPKCLEKVDLRTSSNINHYLNNIDICKKI